MSVTFSNPGLQLHGLGHMSEIGDREYLCWCVPFFEEAPIKCFTISIYTHTYTDIYINTLIFVEVTPVIFVFILGDYYSILHVFRDGDFPPAYTKKDDVISPMELGYQI